MISLSDRIVDRIAEALRRVQPMHLVVAGCVVVLLLAIFAAKAIGVLMAVGLAIGLPVLWGREFLFLDGGRRRGLPRPGGQSGLGAGDSAPAANRGPGLLGLPTFPMAAWSTVVQAVDARRVLTADPVHRGNSG